MVMARYKDKRGIFRQALYRGVVLAESEDAFDQDGTFFFPPESVHSEYLRPADHTGSCLWNGVSEYFDIVIDERVIRNAAWTFRNPSQLTARIKDFIAFGPKITVREV
jgi:uncharacterized protein (DUF427 family)